MILRRVSVLAFVVGVGLLASGCNGEPAPAESTPLFANEQEAFAAAEQTYRDYVDAGNARRADPGHLPAPQGFLIGKALDDDIDAANQLKENGLRLTGDVGLASFRGYSLAADGEVRASACLDVADTSVVNAAGENVTPPSRPNTQEVLITFEPVNRVLLIADSTTGSGSTC